MEKSATGIRRTTLATAGTLGLRGWTILLAVTVGTNLIDFATLPAPGSSPDRLFVLAAILRVGLLFWVTYAVLRRLAGASGPEAIRIGFWRLLLLQIVVAIYVGVIGKLGMALLGHPPTLAEAWLVALLAMTFAALLIIRLLAWHAALAMGAPFASIGAIWRGQEGVTGNIALALIVLVVPIAALHLAFSFVGVRIPMQPVPHLLLALVDGVVQAWQLLLTLALAVVGWRIAGSPPRAG